MHKLITFVIIILSISTATAVFAQSEYDKMVSNGGNAVDEGTKLIYGGLGFGFMDGYHMLVPPLFAGFDYCMKFAPLVPISFGGTIGYAQYHTDTPVDIGAHYLIIDARAAYHFNELIPNKKIMKRIDLYAGLALGLFITGYSVEQTSAGSYDTDFGFDWGLFGGARFFFNDSFGVFGELGYGFSFLNAGLTFKLH